MTIDASSMSSEPGPPRLRFGRASQAGSGPCSVQWELRRNCSLTPKQMLGFYLGLSGVSLGIAGIFWWLGATLVMPFAWLEVLAVGVALLVHAAMAVNSLPGGPAVNQLDLHPPVTRSPPTSSWLHYFMLVICLVIFVAVFGVMFYSI
jgi:hypothetical protein